MITISANDLKKKGISALGNNDEALITVRGEARYVILDIAHYEALHEAELEMALAQTKKDIADGKFIIESAADHIKRVTK